MDNRPSIDEQIRAAAVKEIFESENAYYVILKILEDHFAQRTQLQLTEEEIRAAVKKLIETGDTYYILELLEAHFAEKVQLTDEEIRAAVKKSIETGDKYWIFNKLLEAHLAQRIKLIDEEIGAAIEKLIKTDDTFKICKFLEACFSQDAHLPDYVIRIVVKKLIESIKKIAVDDSLESLLKNHFAQKIQLMDEEIVAIVRKLLYRVYSPQKIKLFVVNDFARLTQVQIVIFAKEMTPDRMTTFLTDYSEALNANRFQWIVEASSPRCIWSFWKKCPATLSQEQLIIVEKRVINVINVERQKLIAILKVVSKHPSCFTLIQYLKDAPWQDLRCLLPESDG
jgi:hypothetical protein